MFQSTDVGTLCTTFVIALVFQVQSLPCLQFLGENALLAEVQRPTLRTRVRATRMQRKEKRLLVANFVQLCCRLVCRACHSFLLVRQEPAEDDPTVEAAVAEASNKWKVMEALDSKWGEIRDRVQMVGAATNVDKIAATTPVLFDGWRCVLPPSLKEEFDAFKAEKNPLPPAWRTKLTRETCADMKRVLERLDKDTAMEESADFLWLEGNFWGANQYAKFADSMMQGLTNKGRKTLLSDRLFQQRWQCSRSAFEFAGAMQRRGSVVD